MAITAGDFHVEEYRALKTEQTARIGTRDNFIFANLTAIAVVGFAALQTGWTDLVLAGAGGVLEIGWVFFANDRKIAWSRKYQRGDLRYRVAMAAGDVQPHTVFGWESVPREWGLTLWRFGGLWFDLGLFVWPPTAALVWWIVNRWDGALVDPLLWAWGWLAVSTVLVAVAAVASTLNRRPVDTAHGQPAVTR